MHISALVFLLCDIVAGIDVVPKAVNTVVITAYTTVCPITRTFTSSGMTLTATKLTTSTIPVAVERTIGIPGPTETHTQLINVNVTRTFTDVKSTTLATVELTKNITSFTILLETLPSLTVASQAMPNTSQTIHELLSTRSLNSRKESTRSTIAIMAGITSTSLLHTTTRPSNGPSQGVGLTTLDTIYTLPASTEATTRTLNVDNEYIATTKASTTLLQAADSQKGQQLVSIESADNVRSTGVPYLPQSLVVQGSYGLAEPSGLPQPVISQGTSLDLSVMLWSCTIACLVLAVIGVGNFAM